jgi:inner membrane protein COX18
MRSPDQTEKQLQNFLKKRKEVLYYRWNISNYARFFPFLQIPVWLSFMEGVRAICGVNAGLFRYFLPVTTGDSGDVVLPGVEPTLATEGFLWFSDLLAGDPSGSLPLFLGLSIVLNVQSGWKTKTLAEASDYSDGKMWMLLGSKVSKGICSLFGVYIALTAYVTGLPAGMMLYWITSTNIATLQSLFIEKVMFARKPLQPWAKKHVRVLKTGEKPPPNKSLLS